MTIQIAVLHRLLEPLKNSMIASIQPQRSFHESENRPHEFDGTLYALVHDVAARRQSSWLCTRSLASRYPQAIRQTNSLCTKGGITDKYIITDRQR